MKRIIVLTFLIVANCLLESCLKEINTCYTLEVLDAKNFTLDSYTNPGDTKEFF